MGLALAKRTTEATQQPPKVRSFWKESLKSTWKITKPIVTHPILSAVVVGTVFLAFNSSRLNAQDANRLKGADFGFQVKPEEKPSWTFRFIAGTDSFDVIGKNFLDKDNTGGLLSSKIGATGFDGNEKDTPVKTANGWEHVITNKGWKGFLVLSEKLEKHDNQIEIRLYTRAVGIETFLCEPLMIYKDGSGGWFAATDNGMAGVIKDEAVNLDLRKIFKVERIADPKFTEEKNPDGGKIVVFTASNSKSKLLIYYNEQGEAYKSEPIEGDAVASR